jgi:predicted  nucleic acid-binding Zn-ribbon protein
MKIKIDPKILQTLHRILRQQTDLKERIEKAPRRAAAAEHAQKQIVESIETEKQELTKLKMAADEKQLLLKEREDRIENLKTKRNSCDSNREYQLLNDQIAADEAANGVLSDEILETLENIDVQEAKLESLKTDLEKATSEAAKINSEVESVLESLHSDLQLVEHELAETEPKLTATVNQEYRRLLVANGENALAQVEDECCGNCYTTLSPLVVDQLRLQQFIQCSTCGSILYMPQTVTN